MSTKLPFMPLWCSEYLSDTSHLTAEQMGAYCRLNMTMWLHGGSLPNDPRKLARIAGVNTRRWHIVGPDVMSFYVESNGRITQKRLNEEHKKVSLIREKRATASRAGVLAKSLKSHEAPSANGSPHGEPNGSTKPLHRAREPIIILKEEGLAPSELPLSDPEPIDASGDPKSSSDDAALAAFNTEAALRGWPQAHKLNPSRRGKLRACVKTAGGLDGWTAAIQRAGRSTFLTGGTRDPFRATFDFLIAPSNFLKLIEGNYDDRKAQPNGTPPRHGGSGHDAVMAAFRAELGADDASGFPSGDPGGFDARGPELDLDAIEIAPIRARR